MTRRPVGDTRARPRISTELRRLLEERLITYSELGAALGVDIATVARWARGESGPQKRTLRQIAEYFGVDPASLIDPQPDDEPIAA